MGGPPEVDGAQPPVGGRALLEIPLGGGLGVGAFVAGVDGPPERALRTEGGSGFLAHHRGGPDEVAARVAGPVALPAQGRGLLALQAVGELLAEVADDAGRVVQLAGGLADGESV